MPNTRSPVLTPSDIEELKRKINPETGKKYTQNDIAKLFGVTRQYVSWVKRNKARSFSKTPRETALEHYPWKTGEKFHNASPNRRMRDHAEYVATGGRGMNEEKLRRLVWFYDFLERENVVVEFDPNIPPKPGVSSVGGFAYRPRRDSDGDLMIRVNEHTTLTEMGKKLWRMPPPEKRPKL